MNWKNVDWVGIVGFLSIVTMLIILGNNIAETIKNFMNLVKPDSTDSNKEE